MIKSLLFTVFTVLWIVLLVGFFIGFGILHLGISILGIEYHLGKYAILALPLFFVFLFFISHSLCVIMLAITESAGAYFGVVDGLKWHWAVGLLIAAPGYFIISYMLVIFSMITASFITSKNFIMSRF